MWPLVQIHLRERERADLMAALEGSPHHRDVPDALEAVVDAPIGEVDEDLLDRLVMVLWVHKLCDPKILRCNRIRISRTNLQAISQF